MRFTTLVPTPAISEAPRLADGAMEAQAGSTEPVKSRSRFLHPNRQRLVCGHGHAEFAWLLIHVNRNG